MASAMQIAFISFASLMVFQTMGNRDGSQGCTERGGNCADSDSADVLLTRGIKMHSGSPGVSEGSCSGTDLTGVCWNVEGTSLLSSPPVMLQNNCGGNAIGPVNLDVLPTALTNALEGKEPPIGVPYTIGEHNSISAIAPKEFGGVPIASGTISEDPNGKYKIEWSTGATYTQQYPPKYDIHQKTWQVSGVGTFLTAGTKPITYQNGCIGKVSGNVNYAAVPQHLKKVLDDLGIEDGTLVKVPYIISGDMVFVFYDTHRISNGTIAKDGDLYTITWGHGATWSSS